MQGPGAFAMMWQVKRRAANDFADWMLASIQAIFVSGSAMMRSADAIQGVRSDRKGPGIGESGMASTLASSHSTMSPDSAGLKTFFPIARSSDLFIARQFLADLPGPGLKHLDGARWVFRVAGLGDIEGKLVQTVDNLGH